MRKLLCFLLVVFLLIPFAVSCDDEKNNEETPQYIEGYDFKLTVDEKTLLAKQINSKPEGDNIAIYTRDYKRDGMSSMTVGYAQEGRVALSVRCVIENGTPVFDIVDRTDDVASAQIPYNGFVITVNASELDGLRANKGVIVDVEGYDSAVKGYERNDLAMFNPGYFSGTASRRVSMINPINDFSENKVYYIDGEFKSEKVINVDNITVVLKRKTANNYGVVSAAKESKITAPAKNELKLVFTGEYNIAYAKHYLVKDERITFSMVSKMNSYTDVPAVVINDEMVKFEDAYRNCNITDDGMYLFDSTYSAAVTPATDKKRVDMIFVDDTVVKVEQENTRSLIPDGNGFVISFVGDDAIKNVTDYKMGSTVNTYFIDSSKLTNMYVKIGSEYICITAKNTVRLEAYTVLYNSDQSANTGSNPYGTEIIIEDDVVTSVQKGVGNAEIPENGYVISIHEASDYYTLSNKIKKGAKAELCLTGPDYNITSLKYTGMNTTRSEGALIIFNGKDGRKTTGTNEFGYEIAVDKDGFVIGGSSAGNMKIPEGGFVLSGHGDNKNAIADAFAIGETVLLDSKTKNVKIIETPDSKISHSKYKYDEVSDKLESAKNKLENLDYKAIGENMEVLSGLVDQAEKAFKEFDYENALSAASAVISSCEAMTYQLIESKTVQNRAVWYRSSEKSDEEVKAVVEKLAKLNVNAIYIETWYEGYCIGKKVDVPGVTTHANNGDYDALDGFVRIAHEYGIEVHSWVHNFFVGHFGDNYKSYNPKFAPEAYEDKYLIDRNGKKHFFYSENNNYFVFLNPNDRECRDMLIDIYKQLVSKYDIDGLHLDYVRFPELNYGKDDFGYNQDIIDGFAKKTGITADPRNFKNGSAEMKAWIEYRCNIVTSFIKEVTTAVRDIDSDLWISAATYPDITLSKNTIFQDVVGLADSGCIDEFFSMSYGIEVDTVLISVNNYLKVTDGKTFYSAGIAAFLESTQLSFAQQLSAVTKAGVDGLSVFSLNSINPETYQNQMTNGAYRNKAVQVYKLSVTASAQMDYICNKIENIDDVCKILNADDLNFIKTQCDEIKKFSDEFDLVNAKSSEKIKWCNDTIAKIVDAKAAIVAECGENDESSMLIKDFEDLEYWLALSVKRLEARK